MYTVIGRPNTRAMRVYWMLEELAQSYEPLLAAPRSEDARAHSVSGKVPSLIVDDEVLNDSVAIVQFLADRHQQFTYPAGTIERARQDSFTQFCVDEIEGALWTAAKNSFVNPENMRVPEIKPVCRFEFANAMKALEVRLGKNQFVMGEQFTVPDLLLGHCAGWAKNAKFELPEGTVGAYFERVLSRPSRKRAMERLATLADAGKGG